MLDHRRFASKLRGHATYRDCTLSNPNNPLNRTGTSTMYHLRTALPRVRTPRILSTRLLPQIRHSSGSPTTGNNPPDHFTKTGEKEQDPAKVISRSYEYSQSGGDDMVAGQGSASYSRDTDPASQKETAGKGNAVNPLELSPASPDLSKAFDNKVCSDVVIALGESVVLMCCRISRKVRRGMQVSIQARELVGKRRRLRKRSWTSSRGEDANMGGLVLYLIGCLLELRKWKAYGACKGYSSTADNSISIATVEIRNQSRFNKLLNQDASPSSSIHSPIPGMPSFSTL